jgi:PAS domain S-box-containing protein
MGRERGANEQRLSSILETVPDIIYRLDTRGKITFINDAVKKYGYSIKELVGTSILEIVHPEESRRNEKNFYLILKTHSRRSKH